MTETIKRKWRAMAGNTRLLVLIAIVVTASVAVTVMVNAVLYDGDGDGMSDTYEQLFDLDASDASDAALNYDADTLDNLAESGLSTDPWIADTDRDGWNDDVDSDPLSRLYVKWGHAGFTAGDDYLYTGPAWWLSAFRSDGQWQTNPPAWHVSATESDGVGSLCIEIDRALQTNDLMMALTLLDHSGSSLTVDLLDTNGTVVATDLHGNLLAGTDTDLELTIPLPLRDNPAASAIRLSRGTGAVTVYETSLYVDDDADGLDSDQEMQLGTSDNNADSDGDTLTDYDEVFIHGTTPTASDSDGDGLSDAAELQTHGTNPEAFDSDGDGMRDGWEVAQGFDPLTDDGTGVSEAGLLSWLKTDSLALADGEAVVSWPDSAGGGSLSQSTASYRPLFRSDVGGIAAVEFDGANDALAGVINAPGNSATIMAVLRFDRLEQPSGDYDYAVRVGTAEAWKHVSLTRCAVGYAAGWDNVYYSWMGPNTGSFRGDALPGQAWTIVTAKHASSNPRHALYINGHQSFAEQYTGALSLTGEFELGRYSKPGYANHYLDGEIAEVLVYDRAITEDERAEIEGYLKVKHGLHDAPVVDAGPDKACIEGASVTLEGSASDDALPGPLSCIWTQVFGPGSVTFADASSPQTAATFSQSGCYVLRLTANDGELEDSDEVEVAVAVAVSTNVPTSDLRLWLKADETTLSHGASVLSWPDRSGNENDLLESQPGLAPLFVTNAVGGFAAVTFDGSDDRLTGTLGAMTGDVSIVVVHKFGKLHQPADDFDYLINLGQAEPWQQLSISRCDAEYASGWEDAYYTRLGPDPDVGSFAGPVLPGQRWQTVSTVHSLTGKRHRVWLDGVEKDAQQYAATLDLNGNVELGRFSTPGYDNHYLDGSIAELLVYACALSDDQREAIEDYLKDKYGVLNAAPQVDAGDDLEIFEGDAAQLSGTVIDDGYPLDPGTVTSLWTFVSGPGQAVFSNAAALATYATFDRDGTYVLRLTAWDGESASSDDLTVCVALAESAQVPLEGLGLWLTADRLTLTDGDGVASWPSRIGTTSVAQVTLSRCPTFTTNGPGARAAVSFDGSADCMSGSLTGLSENVTVITVCRFEQLTQPAADFDYVLHVGEADAAKMVSISRCAADYAADWDNAYYTWLGPGAGSFSGPALAGQQWLTLSAVHSATGVKHQVWIDGEAAAAEQYTEALALGDTLELGRYSKPGYDNHYFDGQLAEVLIYDRPLTLDQLAYVQTYLTARYGLPPGDIDGDGLPDAWELTHFGTLAFGSGDDPDGDGLTNQAEHQLGTNPSNADTDGDGMADGDEVALGKDPNSNNPFKALPFTERFESDTVEVGDLHGQNNWDALGPDGNPVASGQVVVQTNTVYAGERSLELNAKTEDASVCQTFVDPNSDVIWLDLQYMAIGSATPTNEPTGSATFHFNDDLKLVVYDGLLSAGSRWVTLTNHAPVATEEWVRLTTRLDYGAQQWLLCLNGILVADGLGFASYSEKLTQLALIGQRGYADNIGLSTTVPDGITLDGDIIPDNWEEAYFGNTTPTAEDDTDGDGLSNGDEYAAGTDPTAVDSDGDGLTDGIEVQYGRNPASVDTYQTLPFVERFEPDTTVLGDVHGQNGWEASSTNSALVQTNEIFEGAQALMINGDGDYATVRQLFAGPQASVIWMDTYMQAIAGGMPTGAVEGAAMFLFDNSLDLLVYDGLQPQGSEWVALTNHVPYVDKQWVRLTAGLDYTAQQWLLCADGILLADGLGFATPTEKLTCLTMTGQAGAHDNITISTNLPPAISLDGDPMPDIWEEQYFGNQDRDGSGDLDGDGLSDALEYAFGTNPTVADSDGDGANDLAETQWNSNPNGSNTLDSIPWSTAFEAADGYVAGPMDGQQGWAILSGSAAIDAAAGVSGSQGLMMQTGANGQCAVGRLFATATNSVVWTHFKLNTGAGRLPTTLAAGATAVVAIDPNGNWSARNGDAWNVSSVSTPSGWMEITIREDFNTRTWDLYLGKSALFTDLAFADSGAVGFTRFAFFGASDSPMRLDDVTVALTAPGHIDRDGDGLSADQEVTAGTDPTLADTDNDGMPDGLELSWGFDPNASNLFFRIDSGSGTNTWATGFEPAEGYTVGLLNGQNGWSASNGVQVVDTISHEGLQSVLLTGGTNSTPEEMMGNIGAEGCDIVWLTLYSRMRQGTVSEVNESETNSAIFYLNEDHLHAYDGVLKDWVTSEKTFIATTNAWRTSQNLGDGWYRLDVRLDYVAKTYRVCVDGVLAVDNVNFKDPECPKLSSVQISANNDEDTDVHVDAIRISTEEPDGLDFDGDGLFNALERQLGSDPEGLDSDADGIADADEVNIHGTDPASSDSDADGLPDGWEITNSFSPTNATDGAADADTDGLSNAAEYAAGTDHTNPDSDGDGLTDGDEVNAVSVFGLTAALCPLIPDCDGDGLSDGAEVNTHGTNPLLSDTDADGYTDGAELAAGTDPLDPASNPLGAWAHHLRIHVRDIGLTSPLTNVPVLVTLNTERIDYAQSIADGADLRFADPGGALLPYEIQTWNPTGDSLIWVRLPVLPTPDSPLSRHFLMHWGNTNAVDAQNAAAVWSNAYDGVWHLEETTETLFDASSDNHATDIGTASVDGRLGKGRDFQGADRISITPAAVGQVSNAVTLSLWQYGDNVQPQNDCLFEGESPIGREFNVHLPWGDGKVYWDAFGNYDRIYKAADTTTWKGQWNHWTFTRDGSTMAIYLNGDLWHSGSGKTRTYTGLSVFNLGADANGGNNYDGIIDEFRVASTAHSAEWIKVQHLSMTDTLLRFGDQTIGLSAPTDAIEPHTDGSVTLVRSGTQTDRPLSVGITIGGTATADSDYAAVPDTATIPAGEVQAMLPIRVLDNDQFDGDETVVITLKDGDYLISGTNQVTISISDDEEDSDSDGLPDFWEMDSFNTLTNRAADDADSDGLTNTEEHQSGTNPLNGDTDGDGLPDGWELANRLDPLSANADDDPDGDGLTNAEELQYGFDPNDGIADNDQDGLPDAEEIRLFGTNPLATDTDADGTNDAYSVLSIDGTNTSHRNGLWTNSATTLVALDDHYMRAEYTVPITEAGMYRLALDITNVHAQAATDTTFRVQLLIDNIPIGWLNTPPTSELGSPISVPPALTTPWLTPGDHTIRLAWLDDYAANKLLGINSVILQRVDGADLDLSGIADWEEWVLDQGYDTDADGLSDFFELTSDLGSPTSGLQPLTSDSDGDSLADGEELNLFGTDPLQADTDTNGVSDAVLIGTRKGVETSYRRVSHITNVWKEDGDTLYNPRSGILISYDFAVATAGMHRVAFNLRNYQADAPDDYRFKVQVYVNGFNIGTRQVFADLDLVGTGTANIVTPWLTPGTHTISLKWLNDSDTDGRITTIAVDEVRLYGFDAPDSDGDGVQDWQETAIQNAGDSDGDGISDYDEMMVHGTSPVLRDTDGDGINDNVELSLGLSPTNADTDGDGVTDWQEINETLTDPLVAEFDGCVISVDSVNGVDRISEAGSWIPDGTAVTARYRRGQVEYQMTCATGDIHRLRIDATHLWLQSSCSPVTPIDTSDLLIYIDDVYIGKRELVAADGASGAVSVFTPWITPGTHTVRIVWENTSRRLMLKVQTLSLERLGGLDTNADGTPDWIESYLANMTGVDAINATSVVSPICLEGEARYVPLTTVSATGQTNATIEPSTTGRWYSDVHLAATGTTPIHVSFQNGSLTRTTNVTWTALNVLSAGDQMIRKGDSLKLTALPAGATNGTVTIGVGDTNYVTDVTTPVIVEFPEDGDFVITGTYTDDQQQVTASQITVSVISAAFPTNAPACMIGKTRSWSCPDIPPEAVVEADSTVVLSGTTDLSIRMTKINREHHVIARLGHDGPIMARQKLDGFWVQAAVDGYVRVLEKFDTYQIWEQNIVTKLLPDSVDIEISIFIGGVVFADDMTTTRWIANQELNAIGEYSFQLIHPNSVGASVCHRIKAYENGLYLGEAYYSGILIPDE